MHQKEHNSIMPPHHTLWGILVFAVALILFTKAVELIVMCCCLTVARLKNRRNPKEQATCHY